MENQIPDRPDYQCNYCDFLNYDKVVPPGQPKTLLGNYGGEGTPTPVTFSEVMLTGTTISFGTVGFGRELEDGEGRELENGTYRELEDSDESSVMVDSILDSLGRFREARFSDSMLIRVESESSTNDGDYEIASRGVSRDELLLEDTSGLTAETAASAGLVTIYRLLKQPNITTGCPFCGTLNSR